MNKAQIDSMKRSMDKIESVLNELTSMNKERDADREWSRSLLERLAKR